MRLVLKTVLVLLVALVVIYVTYVSSAPPLPAGTTRIVKKVLKSDLPSLYSGETAWVKNGSIDIWYEYMTPDDSIRGNVLLIMGHGTTSMHWSDYFYQPFLDAGYAVIRYDNRGVGLSDWMDQWDASSPYSLEDMATDGLAILDKLEIEKAHVIGISMGGMIAQSMAIHHPDRMHTLISVMSSGFMTDPEMPQVSQDFVGNMRKYGMRYLIFGGDSGAMKFGVAIAQMLKGNGSYELDLERSVHITLFELRERNGYNTQAADQHTAAIIQSGSRYEGLKNIEMPSLIIHGTDDPLVDRSHVEKYAPLISDSEVLWVDGMGHDIPADYTPQIVEAILKIFKKASQTEASNS